MPLNEFQAWAGAHGHDALPVSTVQRAAAAQRCLEELWNWQSWDSGTSDNFRDPSWRGSNLISWLLFFSEVPAVQVLLFQVLKVHQWWCCLTPCGLLWWLPTALGEVGRRHQASGSYWIFAGSISTLPVTRDTAFLGVAAVKNWHLEFFLTQVLLHFSLAFVFTPGCSPQRATFDLHRALEGISFGADYFWSQFIILNRCKRSSQIFNQPWKWVYLIQEQKAFTNC